MPTVPDKTCTTCGGTWPMTAENWRPDKRYRCGFMSRCRECQRRDAKEHRRRNLDAHKKRVREWYAAHPDANARHCRTSWAKHRERYNANRRKRRREQREAVRAVEREHYKRNRLKVLTQNRNYALRKAGVPGEHTPEDIEALLALARGRCHWCGKPHDGQFHVDHRIPLSAGGTNDVSNLVISCPECNLSKQARMPWEWRGRLL